MTNRSFWRLLIALLVLLVLPPWARSQTVITTGPITINDNIQWTIATSDATTAAIAQGLPLRLRDNGQPAFIQVTPTSCTAAVPATDGWTCTTKVPSQLAAAVNVRGTHSLVATWVDSQGVESPASVPFVLTTPAGAPTGFRLTR